MLVDSMVEKWVGLRAVTRVDWLVALRVDWLVASRDGQ